MRGEQKEVNIYIFSGRIYFGYRYFILGTYSVINIRRFSVTNPRLTGNFFYNCVYMFIKYESRAY